MLKSIFTSSIWKLLGSFCSFFSIPILLNKLNIDQYALWVTLTSLIGWISLFDFGAGYSLRNRITEYRELHLTENMKTAVAGTFIFFCMSALLIFLTFIISFFIFDIFTHNKALSLILYIPLIVSFPYFLGPFIYQGISKIPELNFLQFLPSFLWLIILIIIPQNKSNTLLIICILYSLIYFLLRLYTFHRSIHYLRIKIIELFAFKSFKSTKGIIINGSKFFILQISSLILFSIGNIVIYNHLNSYDVSQYDTVNKIFLLVITLYNNIIAIYWTEISKGKALYDYIKLNKLRSKLYYITIAICIILLCTTPLISWFIQVWTKGKINVPNTIILFFILQFTIQTLSYAGSVFLNAFEILKVQIILSIISAALFFPIANVFLSNNIGIISIPLTTAIVILPSLVYSFFKSKKLIQA